MPQGNEQFLQMLGIPLGLLERSDRLERLAKLEEFECTAQASGVNFLKWKANTPSGAVYLVSYAIGGWHRGSPPENSEYRKGRYICFPHNSGQQSRTNIAYKVATKYGNKLSQPTEKSQLSAYKSQRQAVKQRSALSPC